MATATLKNRVLETTTTTGTGALTLAGVPDVRYQTFLAALGAAAYTYYVIEHAELNEWEIGVGIVNGDGTLTRSVVIKSTNSNNLVNFSAGTKEVFVDVPAEKFVALDRDSSALTLPGALSVAGLATLTAGFAAGASSSVTAGTDADTDLSVGSGGGAPSAGRTASLTLNAPDSGGFRGAAKWFLKRAASVIWAVGLFSSVAGSMGSVTDLAFAPNPGSTPVAALSSAGALTLAGGLTVSSGGLAVTGNSTITGTLSGITTVTATTLTGTLSTAVQPNVTTMAGLTSIGTIGTGVWQGTTIVTTYGGTGLSSWTAGDLPYYSAGTTLSKLAIGANANVVLGQSGGVPAWTAQPTMSVGSDADTTVTFGSGGASPTAGRTVTALLNAPDSGSFSGTARVVYQRAGASKYQVGIFPSFAGAAQAITDLQWRDGTSTALVALTTGGQLRTTGGLWTYQSATTAIGQIAADSGQYAAVALATGNGAFASARRWVLSKNATAESGSNVGSAFELIAYGDSGSVIDTPLTIARPSGGNITFASGRQVIVGGAGGAADQALLMSGAAGQTRAIYYTSGTTTRWATYATNTAESGSNAGSDFTISRYSDAGSFLGNILSSSRSSGSTTLLGGGGTLLIGTTDPGGSDLVRASGNATVSVGTDANTTLSIGTGGGAPTAGRSATLNIVTPHSGGNVGSALVQFIRASMTTWMTGVDANVTGLKVANDDFFWRNGSTYYATLTTGGQIRTTGGLYTSMNGATALQVGATSQANAGIMLSTAFTASSGAAFHTYVYGQVTANANNDSIQILRSEPSITHAGKTGVTLTAFSIIGWSTAAWTSPGSQYAIDIGQITATGSASAYSIRVNPPTGATTNYLIAHTTPSTFNIKADGSSVFGAGMVIGTSSTQGTLTTQAADGFAQYALKNAAGATGASMYMASGGTTFVLNVNSKLVTVDNTGALTVNATGSLFSAGTDTNTTLQVGAGGGAPTGGRTAALIISTPSDGDGGSNPGNAQIYFSRNGTAKWIPGIYSAAANVMSANTDFTFFNASSVHVASITQAGQVRSAVGFATKAGAAGAFGTADNFALNFQVNGATVGSFDTNGNLLIGGAAALGSNPSVSIKTLSANAVSTALHLHQLNTGTSAAVGATFGLGDSTGVEVDSGQILVQKTAAYTNGGAASTFMSRLIAKVLDSNVLTAYLTLDANAGQLTLGATTSTNYSYGGAGSFGGGKGVHFFSDRNTAPTSNPSGGGLLYSESGALKWRGSAGTVTTVAPA